MNFFLLRGTGVFAEYIIRTVELRVCGSMEIECIARTMTS